MWFREKQVLCTKCGFLGWVFYPPDDGKPVRRSECSSYWRTRIQTSKDFGSMEDPETHESVNIVCIRGQWTFAQHMKSTELGYIDADTLIQPRKCAYYIGYQPGFSPEEHKELKRDAETRTALVKATLLGAAIGATAAIIAQLLYIIFISSK